jgi:hypothetical protein
MKTEPRRRRVEKKKRKTRSRRIKPKRVLDPEVVARDVRRALNECRCKTAENRLKVLKQLDQKRANEVKEPYEMACGIIGLGCLSE